MRPGASAYSLLICGIAIAACNRAPTVLVENTSGAGQILAVSSDNDVFATDTIAPGAVHCWVIPERVQGQRLSVVVTNLDGLAGSDAYHRPWLDSLALDRSQTLRIRLPRFVQGSPAWQQLRRQRAAEAAELVRTHIATAVMAGQASPSTRDLDELREAVMSLERFSPEAAHYEPQVEITASQRCALGSSRHAPAREPQRATRSRSKEAQAT